VTEKHEPEAEGASTKATPPANAKGSSMSASKPEKPKKPKIDAKSTKAASTTSSKSSARKTPVSEESAKVSESNEVKPKQGRKKVEPEG
jgi:hypothetical protein